MLLFPAVSVVLPVYNAEHYLSATLESTLTQTFRDLEVVAVDDGSHDGSLPILREFAEKDPRVQIVSRPRTGIVGARNDGLAIARGEWIACMDHDDLMCAERIERQVAYMQQHPECVAVGGAVLMIDSDGDPLIDYRPPLDHEQIESELLQARNPMVQPATLLSKQAAVAVGGYRAQCEFAEDYDLFLRLAERGRLANLSEVVLKHRQHLGRASYAKYERQRQVVQLALRQAYERRRISAPIPPVPAARHPASLREFHIRCCCDAWDGGNVRTARKHAWALFRRNPLSPRALDLMARTYLGRRAYGSVEFVKGRLRWLRRLAPRRPN